jgi:hypothetical protein
MLFKSEFTGRISDVVFRNILNDNCGDDNRWRRSDSRRRPDVRAHENGSLSWRWKFMTKENVSDRDPFGSSSRMELLAKRKTTSRARRKVSKMFLM